MRKRGQWSARGGGVDLKGDGRDGRPAGRFAFREWIARQGKSRPAKAGRDEGQAWSEANCQRCLWDGWEGEGGAGGGGDPDIRWSRDFAGRRAG